MAGLNFTPSQLAAIGSRGRSVLVSAAAGSGKTRVLTQRLMAYITDENDPKDIDSFLIITYTRAAAAELRSRILSELMSLSAAHPENRRLRRQANLCYRAQIGTIHSFCTTILRENAHSLGISPDFRVLDEDRAHMMKNRCVELVLEDAYEKMQPEFQQLVDTVGAGRDDKRLENIVLTLHEKMQSHADPTKWALSQKQILDLKQAEDVLDTPWGAYLLSTTKNTVEYWASEMEKLCELMASSDEYEKIQKAYSASVEDTALSLRDLQRSLSEGWDVARAQLPIPFPRLGALRDSPAPEVSDRIKARRDACKKAMEKLVGFFSADSEELLRAMRAMSPAMKCLVDTTLRFSKKFSDEKRRAGCVDFSDLEHLAVSLLVSESGKPTELAKKVSERYTEIMVDEYQDVNAVQDKLFSVVSRDGKNLFMVGDVKQSIYRFRLADPGIFLEKYHSSAHLEDASEGEMCKILLRENFRSRDCVLSAANHVFSNIMSEELGELNYDDEASLKCGATYYAPEHEKKAELCIVELPAENDEDTGGKTLIEARAVAKKIRKLIAERTPIFSPDGVRAADYRDIVILLRSPGSVGGVYSMALSELGIPVAQTRGESFFSSPEVSAVVALLAVIDNPHQDVPLISALRSVFFGFSADELAGIRAASQSGSFYDALRVNASENTKSAAFLEKLSSLRAVAPDLSTDALIRRVYNTIDAPAILSAMPSGSERQKNLVHLMEYGSKFEEDGFRGLFRFVASLRRMTERGEEPSLPGGDGNSVSIMSIHKSKGLEFPIVFLCDTARQFNKRDAAQTVLIHSKLGLGPKFTDLERGIEYPTLARRAIAAKLNEETLSEEMRVLYVAMTRAKERLFITCAMKDPGRAIEKLRTAAQSPIPPQELSAAPSMAHWLIQAAILEQDCIQLSVESAEDCDEAAELSAIELPPADEELVEKIKKRLAFRYDHSAAVELPSKLTATEMKDDAPKDPDSEQLVQLPRSAIFRMPELGQERALTGAERGTATHLVMQYIDFSKTASLHDVKGEIIRLEQNGYLTARQSGAVDAGAILAFFRSKIGQSTLSAKKVLRELPFSLLCDAGDYYDGGQGDSLLLQGVVDCCIFEGEKATIIDYKTDYVNEDNIIDRVKSYSGQVRTYAKAMRRLTGAPVKEIVLYFLRGRMAAYMDENGENLRIIK